MCSNESIKEGLLAVEFALIAIGIVAATWNGRKWSQMAKEENTFLLNVYK